MVEWKKLGDLTSYYRGVTYNKKQEVSLNSGGTKILRANNITLETNSLNYDDIKEVDVSVKIKDYQWLYPNDILICAGSGSKEHVGKVAFIKEQIGYAYGGFMGKIVTQSTLSPRYLFHIISGTLFKDYLKVALNSTTINNLNSEIVNNFIIPIPSLEEQNRIVGILDTFTDSIENLKQQIAQRRKQYEHYLLKILKGFDTEVLEYLADFRYGYTANSSEDGFFRIIRITDIDASGRLLYNDKKYIIDDNKCRDYILNKGDLVVARTGASFGKTLYFQDDEPSVFASFLIQIIPNNKKLDNKYYWHFSRSPIYWNQANALVSKGGQQQFNTGAIKKIKVPLPPLSEQQRIVSILDSFEASISNLEAQLAQRQKQYEYYRNQLLTFE